MGRQRNPLAMKSSTTIVPIVLLAAVVRPAALKMAEDPAAPCDPTKCLPPNCRCSSNTVPGSLDPKTIPQVPFIIDLICFPFQTLFYINLVGVSYCRWFSLHT